jgi:hypothetical protein
MSTLDTQTDLYTLAPWDTEVKKAGVSSGGVGVNTNHGTYEEEKLFMDKFNLSPSDTLSGEAPTGDHWFHHCTWTGSSARRSTRTSRSISQAATSGCGSVFQGVLTAGTLFP